MFKLYVIIELAGSDNVYSKNWRSKIGKRSNPTEISWRFELHSEYMEFLSEVKTLAELYDWDLWGGGVNNYAITLSQAKRDGLSISIGLVPGFNYQYCVCFDKVWNPNNISFNGYKKCISADMNDALKYLHTFLIGNRYRREYPGERICVLGGAYERYPLARKWEYESIDKAREKEGNLTTV